MRLAIASIDYIHQIGRNIEHIFTNDEKFKFSKIVFHNRFSFEYQSDNSARSIIILTVRYATVIKPRMT